MLQSKPRFHIYVEFNRPVEEEERKYLSIESITLIAHDANHERYKNPKTVKIKPLTQRTYSYDNEDDDPYIVIFYTNEIQFITEDQLEEKDISWITNGTIEIANAEDNNLRPVHVTVFQIWTTPKMISFELVFHAIFNKNINNLQETIGDKLLNTENFKIEVDGDTIYYDANRKTRNNFKVLMHNN